MTTLEPEDGTTRADLVQRVALMETMIAEGRRSTARFGWIFVLWGLIDIAGIAWEVQQPSFHWVWPIVIVAGFAIQSAIFAVRRRTSRPVCINSMQTRSIAAVWSMMGLTVLLYVAAAIVKNETGHIAFVAAILMFVGMAHAVSAWILRWPAQGAVAVLWWAGGIATFFLSWEYFLSIFVGEMFFGMIVFGLYAMWLDRRQEQGGRSNAHA
jgi:hypothetical protein